MRLDKFLANSGIGSRSEVKRIIKDKKTHLDKTSLLLPRRSE